MVALSCFGVGGLDPIMSITLPGLFCFSSQPDVGSYPVGAVKQFSHTVGYTRWEKHFCWQEERN